MARIAVTSAVYLGDVVPYIPVARRLHEAGHEPFECHRYAMDCSPATMHADPVHTKLMRHPVLNVSRLGTTRSGLAGSRPA